MSDNALIRALRSFGQGASNAVASNVSAPVDGIAWLLRKGGLPIPQNPVGGSDWMAQQGLTATPQNKLAGLLGETAGMVGPAVVQAAAPKIAGGLLALDDKAMDMARQGIERRMVSGGMIQPATVWHGSPHKFDKFDSSKIGTGEGAQAYGHGLYLAESPKVAQTYKDLNPAGLSTPIRAFKGAELTPGSPEYHAATLVDGMGLQQARKQVAGWIANARPEMAREAAGWQKTLETLNAATSKADFKQLKNTGNMYKVDLPDNAIARMLDYDNPIAEEVRKPLSKAALDQFGSGVTGTSGEKLYKEIVFNFKQAGHPNPTQAATDWLTKQGIPGMRYLDGGSRGSGQGSSNFVVFPGQEDILKILERNGVPIK